MSGEADPDGVAAGEPVFSPCDDIPDQVLVELGLDPATESPDIVGVKQPGWKICKWQGAGEVPALSVFATKFTLDDVRQNQRNTEFMPVEVGGRQGFTYRESADRDRRNCDVAMASGGGVVLISIANLGVDPVLDNPCVVAVERAGRLAQFIPG
ncbi:DUF3558 domain-containing protein [Prescottella defluvii]|uniref:DUF3558 domain-containing protein n=1 Tax=Prescottella defluvii TaxID=1323361 RepID=UPI001E4DD244|nr:DUF3558 domain-containing protein [Prescottella defluvii]